MSQDAYQRDALIAWLEREGFQEYEVSGYWQKAYSLSHSYPMLTAGVGEHDSTCATVSLQDGNMDDVAGKRCVYIGEVYTVPVLAALWAVLNLMDYDEGRDSHYWSEYWRQRPWPVSQAPSSV